MSYAPGHEPPLGDPEKDRYVSLYESVPAEKSATGKPGVRVQIGRQAENGVLREPSRITTRRILLDADPELSRSFYLNCNLFGPYAREHHAEFLERSVADTIDRTLLEGLEFNPYRNDSTLVKHVEGAGQFVLPKDYEETMLANMFRLLSVQWVWRVHATLHGSLSYYKNNCMIESIASKLYLRSQIDYSPFGGYKLKVYAPIGLHKQEQTNLVGILKKVQNYKGPTTVSFTRAFNPIQPGTVLWCFNRLWDPDRSLWALDKKQAVDVVLGLAALGLPSEQLISILEFTLDNGCRLPRFILQHACNITMARGPMPTGV